RRENHGGTEILSFEFKARGENLCSSGARALGCGKQSALGDGCMFWGRPEPGASGLCRRKSGHPAQTGLESTETGENQKAWHQRQTTKRQLGSCLPIEIARGATRWNL